MTTALLFALALTAGKSNQIRPTPSPISNSRIKPREWVFIPRLVYANYSDSLAVTPTESQVYGIHSFGLVLDNQIGITDWFSFNVGFEGYQKLGSITGPSPGDPSLRTQSDVTGNAFKLALQPNFRVFAWAEPRGRPQPGNVWIYVYARLIADLFFQRQIEPLYRTDFGERSLEYRTGAVVHVHVWNGIFVAAFAGIQGVWFAGERTDRSSSGNVRIGYRNTELPYPFFGGDLLWATPWSGGDFDDAISLGAILALTGEDPSGYGGKVVTVNLGYAFHFDFAKAAPKSAAL